jgi:aryl-alcohol dehydrogenase-like predicted oxidoreductase
MKQRMFGRTGRMVSEVGFGSWGIGEDSGRRFQTGKPWSANDCARSRCYVH